MLFEARFGEPVRSGAVTVTFRRWKRRQAVAGNVYRTAIGRIRVTGVATVDPSSLTGHDATAAGYASVDDLVADLRGTPDLPLYRIDFEPVPEADPRDELAATAHLDAAARLELTTRLERLDRASSHGAWTVSTLSLIQDRPGVRAGDLAESVGRETQPFKLDVRKLKNLGLTISLDVGYRLSPRGEAYLDSQADGST